MMRIFLTGASGFIGSRILPALQASGHQVIGLARSDATAQALEAAGVEVRHGTLDAPDSLLAGVESADAVIHTAFDHDFSRFAANCEKDRQAILTIG
ncbi:NAD(P)H-binding protein, partial [Klebsiella quasipneumoniae]